MNERGRPASTIAIALLTSLSIGMSGCAPVARYFMESRALTTGPNGPETPATVGAPFQRQWISSGPRQLDSYVVSASGSCADPPVVLIYHGVQETISLWVRAQKFLYDHCVSSVVFDYTGSGDSSRPARFEAVNDDAVAAYEAVRRHFPQAGVFVLGHSMGSGPMLQAAPHFSVPPAGFIVASPFSSLRDYGARSGGIYRFLASLSPDWWNNVRAIRRVSAPVLVIHSDSDTVNPLIEGREVFAVAHEPKQFVILHGYPHNALYRDPADGWWDQVLDFMSRPSRYR
jgi:alpha-beta hydrolase superfamily lysophospholipase